MRQIETPWETPDPGDLQELAGETLRLREKVGRMERRLRRVSRRLDRLESRKGTSAGRLGGEPPPAPSRGSDLVFTLNQAALRYRRAQGGDGDGLAEARGLKEARDELLAYIRALEERAPAEGILEWVEEGISLLRAAAFGEVAHQELQKKLLRRGETLLERRRGASTLHAAAPARGRESPALVGAEAAPPARSRPSLLVEDTEDEPGRWYGRERAPAIPGPPSGAEAGDRPALEPPVPFTKPPLPSLGDDPERGWWTVEPAAGTESGEG